MKGRFLLTVLLAAAACARSEPPADWTEEAGHRWKPLAVPRRGEAGFSVVSGGSSGIDFENRVRDSLVLGNRILARSIASICVINCY